VISACTKNPTTSTIGANDNTAPSIASAGGNAPSTSPQNGIAEASIVSIDPVADIINETPADPGTLDNMNVSDEIPQ
jgi:hypothetical protein